MPKRPWTFITSHGTVLFYIYSHDKVRGIDIAQALCLTERSVRRIISDLEAEGYIRKYRCGWYNTYSINEKKPMRRDEINGVSVSAFLKMLANDNK